MFICQSAPSCNSGINGRKPSGRRDLAPENENLEDLSTLSFYLYRIPPPPEMKSCRIGWSFDFWRVSECPYAPIPQWKVGWFGQAMGNCMWWLNLYHLVVFCRRNTHHCICKPSSNVTEWPLLYQSTTPTQVSLRLGPYEMNSVAFWFLIFMLCLFSRKMYIIRFLYTIWYF